MRSAYQSRLQLLCASGRLLQTLDVLLAQPIVSVRQVETALKITYKSAQRYVERLVELGLLREITGQARNRLYCADEILQAIDAPLE